MKKTIMLFACIAAVVAAASAQDADRDWANYRHYGKANAELKKTPDVVFMGNSITQGWAEQHPAFFTANNYLGRGISGQVTAQMLARFRSDVLELKPKVVVILAGTNDLAQNDGYISIPHIAGNIASMAQLAQANGIKVVICSVLPAANYSWRPAVTEVPQKIAELNGMLKAWAAENGCTYVDYFSEMEDGDGGLPKALSGDGVHPTSAGYDEMERIITPVLGKLLHKR